jgi:hypothetical protein
MRKRPDGTLGCKKSLTPSAKIREPAGPMILGNMRSLGARSLDVCVFHTTVNVDACADDATVLSFGPRMRFSRRGKLGANVRSDWTQRRGALG